MVCVLPAVGWARVWASVSYDVPATAGVPGDGISLWGDDDSLNLSMRVHRGGGVCGCDLRNGVHLDGLTLQRSRLAWFLFFGVVVCT